METEDVKSLLTQINSGQSVTFSGLMSIQLQPLGGYQDDMFSGSPDSNSTGDFLRYTDFIQPFVPLWPTTVPSTSTPLLNFPPNLLQKPNGILTTYKGIFYNRDTFLEFVQKLDGKVLIFIDIDMNVEKIVEKSEGLKLVFFHFLAGKNYKNWDDFEYKDDEWHIFFRQAKTAPELLEAFDFTFDQIRTILCM